MKRSSRTPQDSRRSRRHAVRGFTILESVVSAAILGLLSVSTMQGMLLMNRNAAGTRVMNLAKAEALMRAQDLQSAPWFPLDEPVVEPANLGLGTHVETVDIGESYTGVGSIPAQVTTVVAAVPNEFGTDIRRLTVTVAYNYVGRRQSISVFTLRAPDKLTAAEQE